MRQKQRQDRLDHQKVNAISNALILVWCAQTNVARFNLYYGPASRHYTNWVSVATNRAQVKAPPGVYYFAVTAVATNGLESDFSQEVSCRFYGAFARPAFVP